MPRLDLKNPVILPPGRYKVLEAKPTAFVGRRKRKRGGKYLSTRPLTTGETFDVPAQNIDWIASDCSLEVD